MNSSAKQLARAFVRGDEPFPVKAQCHFTEDPWGDRTFYSYQTPIAYYNGTTSLVTVTTRTYSKTTTHHVHCLLVAATLFLGDDRIAREDF